MVDVQPDTGVPIKADITVQINIDVPNDDLFSSAGKTLYPIVTLRQSIELTNDQIETLFGQLMFVKNHMVLFRVLLIVFSLIFIAILVCFYICMKKKIDKEEKS